MNMEEIKEAVTNLSREDLGIFRRWFWEFDQERWDEEIEEDVKADVLIPSCGKSIEMVMRAN